MRQRIEIQSGTRTADAGGGETTAWATITNGARWAEINPLRGERFLLAQQLQERITHQVRIRYLSTVTVAMRVLFGTRYFQIHNVLHTDERQVETLLMCEELLAL